jgi:hypothetical protein
LTRGKETIMPAASAAYKLASGRNIDCRDEIKPDRFLP